MRSKGSRYRAWQGPRYLAVAKADWQVDEALLGRGPFQIANPQAGRGKKGLAPTFSVLSRATQFGAKNSRLPIIDWIREFFPGQPCRKRGEVANAPLAVDGWGRDVIQPTTFMEKLV